MRSPFMNEFETDIEYELRNTSNKNEIDEQSPFDHKDFNTDHHFLEFESSGGDYLSEDFNENIGDAKLAEYEQDSFNNNFDSNEYVNFEDNIYNDDFVNLEFEIDKIISEPIGNPIPFAPEPREPYFWPIKSTHKEKNVISYQNKNGSYVGNKSRRFLADRMTKEGEPRFHIGIDLYANFNDAVIACEDGQILNFKHFYTTKGGNPTNSLIVKHKDVIINYGEVGPSSLNRLNLKINDTVTAGQIIGFVGATGMLHFEIYKREYNNLSDIPGRWLKKNSRPYNILNPTKYLLKLQNPLSLNSNNGSTITKISYWDKAIEQNNFYKFRLGWEQNQDAINDFLLPYSGQSNVSLDESSFAEALSKWQYKVGLKDDGVLGPKTWERLSIEISKKNQTNSANIESSNLGELGMLIVNTDTEKTKDAYSTYQFTKNDALWLARFVEGEAGGKDNADNHAVIWAMFNRFGLRRHRVAGWTSFENFIRKYSTTLQPYLNSVGAAERVWYNNGKDPIKYPVVFTQDTYPNTNIRKVQLKKHITLQNKKWEEFNPIIQNLVLKALNGKLPNPGIGNASDFANTYIYLLTQRRKNNIVGIPTHDDWVYYTKQNATENNKIWIGEKPNLDQKNKNAFFLMNIYKNSPIGLVSILGYPKIQNENISSENNEYIDGEFYTTDENYENYENPIEENETATNSIIVWLKQTLNKLYSLSLPLTIKFDENTLSLMNKFQKENGLSITKKINPQTERVLLEKSANIFSTDTSSKEVILKAKTRIEDWTNKSIVVKREITSTYRNPSQLFSLVLHQMAFSRTKDGVPSDPTRFLKIGAHFCILKDGKIIQLHPVSRMIWHAQCLSNKSIGVEFEGNFPNINGKWWKSKDAKYYQKDIPTIEQYESGKFLAQYLKYILGITNINAHRQSSKNRTNDPGPHIWKNVGEWAIRNLSLSDGGNAGKCNDGSPIDPRWKTFDDTTLTLKKDAKNKYPAVEKFEDFDTSFRESPSQNYASHEYIDDYESYDHQDEKGEILNEEDFELDLNYADFEPVDEYEDYESYEQNLIKDLSKAIIDNKYYKNKLGWGVHFDKINKILLPYSGLSNISLGESDFALALSKWQISQGFAPSEADGVLGPHTWSKLKTQINITSSNPSDPLVNRSISPVTDPVISSEFSNQRKHPVTGNLVAHYGIDIVDADRTKTLGKTVVSATDGTIASVKSKSDGNGAGNRIHIIDTAGYKHSYFHLSDNNFAAGLISGVKVKMGQKIGEIGNTGRSSGPHLHYETIHPDGTKMNPRVINSGLRMAPNKHEVREFEYEFEYS